MESSVVREDQIEYGFIGTLQRLKYEYRTDIIDRTTLEANFREKFEDLNRVRLTDGEFARLLDEIITPDVFAAAKLLRQINSFTRDDGIPLNYTLVNIKDWCKNTFEVINQLRINTDNSHHRYDVIILINGIPCVQIELKTLTVNPRRAMEQIVEYKNDPGNGYAKTLLCFLQLFIVSNRTNTYYFANNNARHFAFNADERFLPIYQFSDEKNKKITHLEDFAASFLVKCTLGRTISRYMVLIASEYFGLFQTIQAEKQAADPDFHPLNIACVFSPPAQLAENPESKKDIEQLAEDLEQERADNEVEPEKKKDALKAIVADYNTRYGTNHKLSEFDLYYQDVQKRIKDHQWPNEDLRKADPKVPHHKIDITIVVDMLLTGFDSKFLNTLYVDKKLKHHGLIQAFSRTNRVLNSTKPYGNILDFRQQQDAVDTAIRDGYTGFKAEKDATELATIAARHQLATAALQTFVDGILQRMIFDGEHLSDLMAPLDLGWKARTQAELALMADLHPLLTKRAQGRDISGLSAYES